MTNGYLNHFTTRNGDRIFPATFSRGLIYSENGEMLCKRCTGRVVVAESCAWTAGKEKTGAKQQQLAYVHQLMRC